MRPIEIVRKLCPKAKASYLAAIENGEPLFFQNGIITPLRMAHFLAQICHESDGLTIDWENGNYTAERIVEVFGPGKSSAAIGPGDAERLAHNGQALFERTYGLGNSKLSRELGNTQPGDGWRYRGGGLMQTTGRANYRRMGQKCGVDFEKSPELVLSADHALKPALAEWTEGHLNDAADRNDILTITKKINGGTNGLDSREEWLARLRPLCASLEIQQNPPVAPAPKPAPTPIPPPPDIQLPPPQKPAPNRGPLAAALALLLAAIGSTAAAIKSHPNWTAAAVICAVAAVIAIVIHHKRKAQ